MLIVQVIAYQPQQQQQQSQQQSQQTPASLTPVQQQVVQQYIHQKNVGSQPYQKKRTYTQPTSNQTYYCDICRISCASQLVSGEGGRGRRGGTEKSMYHYTDVSDSSGWEDSQEEADSAENECQPGQEQQFFLL